MSKFLQQIQIFKEQTGFVPKTCCESMRVSAEVVSIHTALLGFDKKEHL